ncbi:hypothetical protein [Ralstonia pseudosolanacearum]
MQLAAFDEEDEPDLARQLHYELLKTIDAHVDVETGWGDSDAAMVSVIELTAVQDTTITRPGNTLVVFR